LRERFEPPLIGFLCDWCAYAGADAAGRAGKTISPFLKTVRLPCSGRMDPAWILLAFRQGAQGVLIAGCPPGNCHFQKGNAQMIRMTELLKPLLRQLGFADLRLRVTHISAQEGEKFATVVAQWVEEIREAGPLAIDF
jgi:F420-non-reducing hydrogenase iron-sulfur subunit